MGLLSTLGAASARAYGFTRSAIAAAVDAYFNRVTLLLPGNGTNGAQNNTFLDSSTNNFTITRNGNTTQGTFSPFSQTGWSNYFSGTSYFTIPSAAYTSFSNSADWTIEFWFNTTVASATFFSNYVNTSPYAGAIISLITGGQLDIWEGGTHRTSAITGLNDGKWHHVAWVNSSGTSRVYVDGTLTNTNGAASFTTPASITRQTAWYVGYQDGSVYLTGYISNLRVVKGAAVYTSNFTPSTTSLGTTSGGQNPPTGTQTVFLTCQNNRFVDNSSNAATITITGSTSVQAFSPFAPSNAYSASTNGGSGYFDGSGDYLTTPCASGNSAFGTGDFTVETWIYPTASATFISVISSNYDNSTAAGNWAFYFGVGSATTVYFNGGSANSGSNKASSTTTTIPLNSWTHIAYSRVSNVGRFFVNGTQLGTTLTDNDNYSSVTGTMYFGRMSSGTLQLTGYLSGLRIIKGTGYTSISVPSAPPTAITNTSLLINFTNAGITDATGKNVLETLGNAQISTTQSKFGGSSMYFDGTGDYLLTQSNVVNGLGTGNWTIEYWVNPVSVSAESIHVDFRSGSGAVGPTVGNSAGGAVFFQTSGVNRITGSTLSTGTWTHIAVSKSGSSTKLFINGTQSGSTYTDANTYTTPARVCVGVDDDSSPNAYLNGYIDDLRITKGYARYTANFTAPTAAFALQ